ncbi:hypothetical protein IE53DRAFT_360145 [Violaceomyces palustris]|uniref:Uncharacterized protein n=1 Tax=Violaceomyces palustris TaxID=1673888 RepID=A0ACD0P5A6_9BASI|nr:hypothetical protein IE53DRAFT_360145 [Violaceomyces palustris]
MVKKENSKAKRERADSPGQSEPHPILLKLGVRPLTGDDYFVKSAEFKHWLAQARGVYLDEITGKEARRLFDKFTRRWNAGSLDIRSSSTPLSTLTRHKWAFTSRPAYTESERETVASVRDSVDTMTNVMSRGAIEAREAERKAWKQRTDEKQGQASDLKAGPVDVRLTDSGWNSDQISRKRHHSDIRLVHEIDEEREKKDRVINRKRRQADMMEAMEDQSPRSTGRDAMIEKKRAKAISNRDFANRRDEDDGFDVREEVLMGDGYEAGQERHKRGSSRREREREAKRAEKNAEAEERLQRFREKESSTMAMFKKLAEERFGGTGS